LLNAKGNVAARAIQFECEVTDHRISRSQGFAEVGEQAFGVDVFYDGEQLTRLSGGFRFFRFR
jgi:hypothetical protein